MTNQENLLELEKASERLIDAIKTYMNGLGSTGIVVPTPPRPKLDEIGKLTFGGTLVAQGIEGLRRLP